MNNIYNIISDIESVFNYTFNLEKRTERRWIIRVRSHDNHRTAKIELIIDSQEESVVGSLLRFRGFSRQSIETVMNSIVERF